MYAFAICELKLSPNDFWNSTPLEMKVLYEFHIKKMKANQKNDLANTIMLAWNIANFSNAKKLPDLQKILKDIYKENKKEVSSRHKMSKEEIERHYGKKVVR